MNLQVPQNSCSFFTNSRSISFSIRNLLYGHSGWLVGWLGDLLAGLLVDWLVGWLVIHLFSYFFLVYVKFWSPGGMHLVFGFVKRGDRCTQPVIITVLYWYPVSFTAF
jgi:hypothetical protein